MNFLPRSIFTANNNIINIVPSNKIFINNFSFF